MSRLFFFFLALPGVALAQAPVPAEVRLAQASFREYLELLSLPNDLCLRRNAGGELTNTRLHSLAEALSVHRLDRRG
jgi:hypothetical protein